MKYSFNHIFIIILSSLSVTLYGLDVETIEEQTYETLEEHRLSGSTAEVLIHSARVINRVHTRKGRVGVTELFNKAIGSTPLSDEARANIEEKTNESNPVSIQGWSRERKAGIVRDRTPETGMIMSGGNMMPEEELIEQGDMVSTLIDESKASAEKIQGGGLSLPSTSSGMVSSTVISPKVQIAATAGIKHSKSPSEGVKMTIMASKSLLVAILVAFANIL